MGDEERVQDGLENLKVEPDGGTAGLGQADDGARRVVKQEGGAAPSPDRSKASRSRSRSKSPTLSPEEQKARSDSASTPDGVAMPPKLARKASSKAVPRAPARPAMLFDDLPDVTESSKEHFQIITDCLYGSKSLGSTEHDALDCDCTEEWRRCPVILRSHAARAGRLARWLTLIFRRRQEPCLRRGLGLHQPSHQDGVC